MAECHCIIAHPQTKAERTRIAESLDRARRLNDRVGTLLALAQLTSRCRARDREEEKAKPIRVGWGN